MELDGRPVSAEELAGLALYNYGHFTSLLVDAGRTRGLQRHLDRLGHDAFTLFGCRPGSDEQIRGLIRRATTSERRAVVRVTVFAPDLQLGRPSATVTPRMLVTTRSAPVADAPADPLRLRTAVYERELPNVKHVALFGTMTARRNAQLLGYDDVLFVDRSGFLREGATWNVGFRGQTDDVLWPAGEQLDGVTMALLKDAIGSGSTVEAISLADIGGRLHGHVGFVTNAVTGVRRIASIDDIELGASIAQFEGLERRYAEIPWDLI